MDKLLLLAMAVALVGCAKENPHVPIAPHQITHGNLVNRDDIKRVAAKTDWPEDVLVLVWDNYEREMNEWYDNLGVCLHCGSDLEKKGRKLAPGAGGIR